MTSTVIGCTHKCQPESARGRQENTGAQSHHDHPTGINGEVGCAVCGDSLHLMALAKPPATT
eukprot:CAMPEP_0115875296 /NCGR_PEP_ID=MMETSP0287-20121206/25021_1 /TAXON_ID=412157 /ORGANISM="Chrysochromulina rotalis, Strain UIO044" /LENGTH=61 /DNA_ID=CAMNT_0003330549 /DNA_START=119 /DNA_END=300 /DNA_ORIENTATION=-